jgi:hypothetical protein
MPLDPARCRSMPLDPSIPLDPSMPLDAARCRSMPLDVARCRSMPLDPSMPLDAARCRSMPLDAARCRSMPLDVTRSLDVGVVGVDKQAIFPALWPSRKEESNGWRRLSAYVKGAGSFSNPARSTVV